MEEKVQKIIDKMRPYVQMHGGDVFLEEIKDGMVNIRVTGACAECSLSDLTYKEMFGGILKTEVPGVKGVVVNA